MHDPTMAVDPVHCCAAFSLEVHTPNPATFLYSYTDVLPTPSKSHMVFTLSTMVQSMLFPPIQTTNERSFFVIIGCFLVTDRSRKIVFYVLDYLKGHGHPCMDVRVPAGLRRHTHSPNRKLFLINAVHVCVRLVGELTNRFGHA